MFKKEIVKEFNLAKALAPLELPEYFKLFNEIIDADNAPVMQKLLATVGLDFLNIILPGLCRAAENGRSNVIVPLLNYIEAFNVKKVDEIQRAEQSGWKSYTSYTRDALGEALRNAASKDHGKIVDILFIQKEIDINKQNYKGATAATMATPEVLPKFLNDPRFDKKAYDAYINGSGKEEAETKRKQQEWKENNAKKRAAGERLLVSIREGLGLPARTL